MLNIKFFLKLLIFAFILINSNLFIAHAEQKVSKIIIEGNQRVDDDTILSFIKLSEGSSYVDIDVNFANESINQPLSGKKNNRKLLWTIYSVANWFKEIKSIDKSIDRRSLYKYKKYF